jgi:hypothetical protein
LHTLVYRWKEPAAPDALACIGCLAAGGQDDKSRKVVVLLADAIGDP